MNPFEEVYIGDCLIKNRFAMAPMISSLADADGSTNEVHTEYLTERAAGGFGLIITEYSFVPSRNSRGSRNQLSFARLDQTPKFRRIAENVHGYGSKIFAQIVHAGGKAVTENGELPFAPSPVMYNGRMPAEMSERDIEEVIGAFAQSAKIAELSGFDGIELHGAHGYLIHEFLSPALNRRNDRWGGSLENMLRFPQEIIKRVREEVTLPVGMRLSLYEDDQDGYPPEHGLKIAESLKNIDYVHFSAGRNAPPGSSAPFYYPHAHILRRLTAKPSIKTMIVGSISDKETVENALETADMVSIGREALADPFFPEKMRRGLMPRPCIRCNQACRDFAHGQVRCTINYETGRETLVKIQELHGDVKIAGAGVAGMEAAIYLARCGMHVAVFEKAGNIGGQINEIFETSQKNEFQKLVSFYREEAKRLGIELKLNHEVSGKDVDLWLAGGHRYPGMVEDDEMYVDSNIYAHLDACLRLAGKKKIVMTERSLSSLDRGRQAVFRRIAQDRGITFVKEPDERFAVNIIERRQIDLGTAVRKGISEAMRFASELRW